MSECVVNKTQKEMTMEIDIALIRIDGGTQQRVAIDQEHVADISQSLDECPPIVVFHDGAEHWLADGFHRYHAARKAGATSIKADVRPGTQRDAVLYSLSANSGHGLKRSNADKRRAVNAMLADAEWGKWSDRRIAAACNVHHGLVASCRAPVDETPPAKTFTPIPPPPPDDEVAETPPPPPPDDEEPAPAQVPTDKAGKPITEESVLIVFRDAHSLRGIVNLIDDALRMLRDAAKKPVGAELRMQRIEAELTSARTAIKHAMPFAQCPYMPNCERGCKSCKTKKWVNESTYNAIPAEIQQA